MSLIDHVTFFNTPKRFTEKGIDITKINFTTHSLGEMMQDYVIKNDRIFLAKDITRPPSELEIAIRRRKYEQDEKDRLKQVTIKTDIQIRLNAIPSLLRELNPIWHIPNFHNAKVFLRKLLRGSKAFNLFNALTEHWINMPVVVETVYEKYHFHGIIECGGEYIIDQNTIRYVDLRLRFTKGSLEAIEDIKVEEPHYVSFKTPAYKKMGRRSGRKVQKRLGSRRSRKV